ncbi:MAG: response regulator, partial [Dyella sp.]|nr:response regulator [Dyella sp.]
MAEGLCRALRACGYAVDRVANGPEADAAMRVQRFDLVILELGLPGMSGFDVLRRLRRRESNTPVLILTAADSIASRVKGLDLGADDFMPKPFALSELEARVRALLRRGSHVEKSSTIRNGAIEYDKIGRVAYVNGKVLDMSGREI